MADGRAPVHFTSLRSALSGGPPVDRIFEQMADAILDKVSVSPLSTVECLGLEALSDGRQAIGRP